MEKVWTPAVMRSARVAVVSSETLGDALDMQPYESTEECSAWNDLVIFLWSWHEIDLLTSTE